MKPLLSCIQFLVLPAAVAVAAEPQTLVLEDFSRFTEGSEKVPSKQEVPVDAAYRIPADMMSCDGWHGGGLHQAGGVCSLQKYTGSYGYESYGFISTPPMDLGGTAVLTFRARRPAGSSGNLWVCLCDDYFGPGEDQKDIHLTGSWQTYTLTATQGSTERPSYFQISAQDGTVLIDDIQIDYVRDRIGTPYALQPVNHSLTSFTATWEDSGAPLYLFNLYYAETPASVEEGAFATGFDEINIGADGKHIDASDPGYPEGWTVSLSSAGSQDVATAEGCFLSGPLSLVFDAEGDAVESPLSPLPVSSLSFWLRPTSTEPEINEMTLLGVRAHDAVTDKWVAIANLPNYWCSPEGTLMTFDEEELGRDIDRIRLELVQKGSISFMVDDVAIGYKTQDEFVPVQKDVELTATSYRVDGIDPDRDYYYHVQALDKDYDLVSEQSNRVWVDGLTGIALKAEKPSDSDENGFTAVWQPLPHAADYVVEVYSVLSPKNQAVADVTVIEEDFNGSGWDDTDWSATNPIWVNGMGGSAGTTSYGTAGLVYSPEIDLSCNGGLSFDVEASLYTTIASYIDDGKFETEGIFVMLLNTPDDTTPIASSYIPCEQKGLHTARVTVEVPAAVDLSRVIVAFMSKSGQEFYVDNARISQTVLSGESMIRQHGAYLSTESSLKISMPAFEQADTDRAYRVYARRTKMFEDYQSDRSDLIVVPTPDGVSSIESDGAAADAPAYDLLGRPYTGQGIRISKTGKTVE